MCGPVFGKLVPIKVVEGVSAGGAGASRLHRWRIVSRIFRHESLMVRKKLPLAKI